MLLNQRSDDIVRNQYLSRAAMSDLLHSDSVVPPIEDKGQAKTAHCATITGSMLGAISGCLAGMGILGIPGFVPILAIGSAGTAVVITLAGAGIGLAGGGLISALAATDESED